MFFKNERCHDLDSSLGDLQGIITDMEAGFVCDIL
jgi:hypothetical protein